MGTVKENRLAGQTAGGEGGADHIWGQNVPRVFPHWQLSHLLREVKETF